MSLRSTDWRCRRERCSCPGYLEPGTLRLAPPADPVARLVKDLRSLLWGGQPDLSWCPQADGIRRDITELQLRLAAKQNDRRTCREET